MTEKSSETSSKYLSALSAGKPGMMALAAALTALSIKLPTKGSMPVAASAVKFTPKLSLKSPCM